MRWGFCVVVSFFILVYLALADEDLKLHRLSKRNRFVMKDKSVVYNESVEDETSLFPTTVTLPPTTKKPEQPSEEISDAEAENKRLAQQMKDGVQQIDINEYLEETDSQTASTPSQKEEKSKAKFGVAQKGEASGDIPQKVEKPQNVDDSRNFEQTNQLPPVTTTPESISIPQSIVQSAPSKTLHLKEAIPTGEEGSRFQEWREYDDSLIVPNFDMQSALKDFGMYGFQESANRQVPHWSSTNTRYQPPAFVFQQQASTASKGEKGDRGEPGVCTQRCVQAEPPRQSAGPPGVPGIQGLKGEKGECIYERSNRPAYESNALPTDENSGYENRAHRYGSAQKGQKGDRGDRGETGARGPPGLPSTSQTQHTHSNVAAGGVKVYQTAVELFSAAPQTHVGSLAFALSDQQLFIRVNNGWQSVKLDSFHPAVERRPTAAAGTETQQFQKPPSNNLFDRNLVNQEQRSELDDQHKHHAGHKHTQNTHPENNPEWYNRHQYEVEHEKKLHMIALNDPLDGNLGGVRGADLECYHQARQAGFKTTFRAFLVYPDDRSTPVYNLRGEKLFDSWNSIFESGVHSAVPILSFNGKNVFDDNGWNDRWIWHGSSSQGNRKLDGFCDIWRSSSASSYGIASPLAQNKPLTFAPREVPCYRKLGILCVENMSQYNVQRRVGKRIPNFYFDNYL
ncbi:CLE-1C protein [Aphelenchoides bicaudatus]|nr:CLE-1C protein [Aphelenchoides bicaudatus]